MKEGGKSDYETPEITVVEVKHEGVICVSGNATKNGYTYDNEENW